MVETERQRRERIWKAVDRYFMSIDRFDRNEDDRAILIQQWIDQLPKDSMFDIDGFKFTDEDEAVESFRNWYGI